MSASMKLQYSADQDDSSLSGLLALLKLDTPEKKLLAAAMVQALKDLYYRNPEGQQETWEWLTSTENTEFSASWMAEAISDYPQDLLTEWQKTGKKLLSRELKLFVGTPCHETIFEGII